MEVYGKSVASIESADDEKFGPNGGFTAILSSPSLDRDGDRLMREEWQEPFAERYPLDIDHGMSVADTVGSFSPYFEGDQLMMDAYFASTAKAQDVRALVNEQHIRTVSVAFMTDRSKKDGEPRRELLNAGIVAIPSNRDAVILASKAYAALKDTIPGVAVEQAQEILASEGESTEQEKALVKSLLEGLAVEDAEAKAAVPGAGGDRAMTQAIHDASVHLGAQCTPVESNVDASSGSSEGANKELDELPSGTILDGLIDSKEALMVEKPEHMTEDQFKTALEDLLKPQEETPVSETPAEAAAASEEEPAPAEDAAVEETAVDSDSVARAMEMQISLLTSRLGGDS